LAMSGEPKCVQKSGGVSLHWWLAGAKVGDLCLCGSVRRLEEPSTADRPEVPR
jgi:hypothetical protein